jgi:hypothetical protein
MSKRGPRFSEKEKLTIIAEGEKIAVARSGDVFALHAVHI